ncbi:MAG: DUF5668 domain-containing protein [Terracidiphilus sp.]|jgi:hypothetical protein
MSRYIMIRRLRFPAILLLIGGIALLHQTGVIDHFWHWFWPLLLILLGVIMLAERAALAADGGYPLWPYPGQPGPGAYPGSNPGATPPSPPAESSANVSSHSQEFGKDSEGGQS